MLNTGASVRVIIAVALLLCVFPENNGIAADVTQPDQPFPAGSVPEAVAIENVNNDVAILAEEPFPWPLFISAIIAGKQVCTAIPNGNFEAGNTAWIEYSELGLEVI